MAKVVTKIKTKIAVPRCVALCRAVPGHDPQPKNQNKSKNYDGVRIIWMIKQSEMRPLGGATFWDNHLPADTMILTPILVCLKPKILPIRWCHFL